jgi:hypothetical protein
LTAAAWFFHFFFLFFFILLLLSAGFRLQLKVSRLLLLRCCSDIRPKGSREEGRYAIVHLRNNILILNGRAVGTKAARLTYSFYVISKLLACFCLRQSCQPKA